LYISRSFGILDEDCCGDWRWDLCRTPTNITRTSSTHPTTTHLHSSKMPKDLHSDEERGPPRQHPRTVQARVGWWWVGELSIAVVSRSN
jgi:hypothetical protein